MARSSAGAPGREVGGTVRRFPDALRDFEKFWRQQYSDQLSPTRPKSQI
jgi:hypothetical protein